LCHPGGDRQIVYAQDIYNPTFRAISTLGLSDALSVQQINSVSRAPCSEVCDGFGLLVSSFIHQNECIVGLRSGQLCHYDFRLENQKAASKRGQTNTITNLHVMDSELGGGRGILAAGFKNEVSQELASFNVTGISSSLPSLFLRSWRCTTCVTPVLSPYAATLDTSMTFGLDW
jgi:hypothetical protein